MVAAAPGESKPIFMDAYARPATRGELRKLLDSGVPCEVASHVAEMTRIMLDGWLPGSKFTVRPSENAGWSVFEA